MDLRCLLGKCLYPGVKVGHLHNPHHHHAHLSPGTQLASGGGGAKVAAALLAGWAQHLENDVNDSTWDDLNLDHTLLQRALLGLLGSISRSITNGASPPGDDTVI